MNVNEITWLKLITLRSSEAMAFCRESSAPKKYGNTWTITSWIHQLSTSQPVTRKKGPRAHSGSIHDLTCFYIILYNHILEKSQIAKLPALSRTSNTTRTWWSPQSQRQSVVFLTVQWFIQWSSNGHPMVIQWSSNGPAGPTGPGHPLGTAHIAEVELTVLDVFLGFLHFQHAHLTWKECIHTLANL